MTDTPSWSIGSGSGSPLYAFFDWLRNGVCRHLANYFKRSCPRLTRVLEAGSGPGFTSALISRSHIAMQSVALDLDFAALSEGRAKAPDLVAAQGTIYRLPFPDGSFDLVWNSSTMEHLDDFHAALLEMRRVCRSEGFVFVGVPSAVGPLAVQRLCANSSLGIWIGTAFTRRELARELAAAGLQPVDWHHYFFRFFLGCLARPIPTNQ